MKKLILLMSEFGATFLPKNKFNFPLKLISTQMPIGIQYEAGISAQLKSAVILAGLNSYGNRKLLRMSEAEIILRICFQKILKQLKFTRIEKNN